MFPLSDAGALRRRSWLALAFAAAPLPVLAQSDYPNRPVTLIVPFPAGGPTDASARMFAKLMGDALGQPVVIDNRAGAAGTTGSAVVARAGADGYTLLWGGTSTLAVAPALHKNLKYDTSSFVPIGMALRGPLMIAAHPGSGIESLQDLVKTAKQRSLSIGTAGTGSVGHLATELLKETAAISLTHVPYRGGGPALNDVLGGQINLIFDNASALYPHVKSGKLRALAVTGQEPYALAPEVPTVKQMLGNDYEAYSWFGLVAPRQVPQPVLQRLGAAFAKAAQSADLKRQLSDQGLEPGLATSREFGAAISADFQKWSGIITRANVQPE